MLINLTIIGDGWGVCDAVYRKKDDAKSGAYIWINDSLSGEVKTFACDTSGNSCGDSDDLLVWGGYTQGGGDCVGNGNKPSFCTGLAVYQCKEFGDIWNVVADGIKHIPECDTVNGKEKKGTFNKSGYFVDSGSKEAFYDLYVIKGARETISSTGAHAYQFYGNPIGFFVCKKKIEKIGATIKIEVGAPIEVEETEDDDSSAESQVVEETGDDTGGDSSGSDSSAESQVVEEICGSVQCNSGMNGKSIFCAENKDDTYVYKCDSGKWNEVDVYGYCCNKNCSKPKKTNFVLGGSWTTDTGHEMWFSTTARISEIAWLFNSTDVNNNCTICKDGTKYNKNTGKCE